MQQPTWAPASTDGTFLDLRDYGRVIARRRKLIAACVAVAGTGTSYAYYGQYSYEQQPLANGIAYTWDRLRKKNPSS